MSDSWSEEFIGDYIDGRLSQAERDRFELHLNEHPRDAEVVEELLQVRADLKNQPRFQLDDQFTSRVLQAIGQSGDDESVESSLPSNGKFVSKAAASTPSGWKSVVAIVGAVAATLLVALFSLNWPQSPEVMSRAEDASALKSTAGEVMEKSAQENRQTPGGLADGDMAAADANPIADASAEHTQSDADGLPDQLQSEKTLQQPEIQTKSRAVLAADDSRRMRENVSPSTDDEEALPAPAADNQPRIARAAEKAGSADDAMETLKDDSGFDSDEAEKNAGQMARQSPNPIESIGKLKYDVVAISKQLTAESSAAIRGFAGLPSSSDAAMSDGQSGVQMRTDDQLDKLKGNSRTSEQPAEDVARDSMLFQGEKEVDGSTVFALQATDQEMKQLLAMLDGESVSLDRGQMAEVIRQFEAGDGFATTGGGGGGFGGGRGVADPDHERYQKKAAGQKQSDTKEMEEDTESSRQAGGKRGAGKHIAGGRGRSKSNNDAAPAGNAGDDKTPAAGGRTREGGLDVADTRKATSRLAEFPMNRRTWLLVVKPLEAKPAAPAETADADSIDQ